MAGSFHLAGLGAAVAGMLLIAATYGLARFGVGLHAPGLAATRPQLAGVLGWAAAAQFLSYATAAVVAARLVDQRPRAGLVVAGATATAGCVGVAVATHPAAFVAAVVVGGMAGGFASPALVPVVDAVTAPARAGTAQSLVNAGTAVGVVAAGATAAAFSSTTAAWLAMAAACAVATLVAWWPVRSREDLAAAAGTRPARGAVRRRALAVPAVAAVVVGAGSALTWTFGPLLLTEAGVLPARSVGELWTALGVGGLLGPLAGVLVVRAGLRGAWALCSAALALASAGVGVAVPTDDRWLALVAMAAFGAGYMAMSAVLILWARRAWPRRSGAGTSVLFVALATGQALGSAAFGVARSHASTPWLAAVAACLCAAGAGIGLVGRRAAPRGTVSRHRG
ncbi:MFS transporter [Nocardioides xinjiangensis]|uniref:MFS transporter n=1 Tax=Nocardioides xinjiangensis TaxID=2817376 RepID=UPI001B30D89C|nr:MFS transporter [Nocardioides sp. SYSU D00514]